ncbi:MAG: hypothetical protein L0Z54_04965 [Thermoplasmata archaeon]|nr:hypothetical protein [Thermoplasmata archaeon]
MRAEEVNSEAILEAIREYERWLRMFQVNAHRIREAVGAERALLVEQAHVIAKHLRHYEDLLREMKRSYSPTGLREILTA